MATLAPAPRTNLITVGAASAGPFLVGFRLFETTGLRVYVDGVLSTSYTVSATFVDGYDDAATITFSSVLAASTKIQIDGFMTAQRQSDYLNGPKLIDFLNIELARLWAVVSEDRMLLKRAILGLSEIGSGDVADAGGRRIKNVAAPEENNDVLRLIDLQNVVAGAGNVPSPLVGQIGYLLQATGTGVFGWISRAVALGVFRRAILTPMAG